MSVAPNPETIYDRSKEEGRRRLSMPFLEQVATGFIAGITIVFGIVALGITESLVGTEFGDGIAALVGALAFGIGVVFLVVGRSELFSENFFDPVAAAIDEEGASVWGRLARLWTATLVLNSPVAPCSWAFSPSTARSRRRRWSRWCGSPRTSPPRRGRRRSSVRSSPVP
jgi:formate/nitrite transporter FocA (FNT family)